MNTRIKTMAKIILMATMFATNLMAKEKIIIKYKKYEKFDLGSLQVKGNIIAPGDISVRKRGKRLFHRKLYNRLDWDKEMKKDVNNLR